MPARSKAWVCGHSPPGIVGFESRRRHGCLVSCKSSVLSSKCLCVGLITRPEESYYRMWFVSCDRTASMMRPWPIRGWCDMEKIIINKYYKMDLGNLISYENEVDIDNKLNNPLKITSNMNNTFRSQKTLRKQQEIVQCTGPSSFVIRYWKLDH